MKIDILSDVHFDNYFYNKYKSDDVIRFYSQIIDFNNCGDVLVIAGLPAFVSRFFGGSLRASWESWMKHGRRRKRSVLWEMRISFLLSQIRRKFLDD